MDYYFGHIILNDTTISWIWKLSIHTSSSVQLHFSDLCLKNIFKNHEGALYKIPGENDSLKKNPFEREIIYILLNKSKIRDILIAPHFTLGQVI